MSDFSSYKNSDDEQIRKWAITLEVDKLKPYRRNQIQKQIINRIENYSKWICPFTKKQYTSATLWGKYINSKKYKILTGELTELNCKFCSDSIIKGEELDHYKKKVKCSKQYRKWSENEYQRKKYKRWGYLENYYNEHNEHADKWTTELLKEMNEYLLNEPHLWNEHNTIEKNDFNLYIKIRLPELVNTTYEPISEEEEEEDYTTQKKKTEKNEKAEKYFMDNEEYIQAVLAQKRYDNQQQKIEEFENKIEQLVITI